jgi:competence protein ComEA
VIDTTARRDRGVDETRDRLACLMGQARSEPHEVMAELAANQEWVDVSVDLPDPDPPPREPWWRRGPAARLTARWAPAMAVDPGRRRLMAVVLVGGLVLAVLVAIGVAVSSSGTEYEPPPVLPVAAATESTVRTADTAIVVSVVGRVVSPGLITLSEGARVADALRETGGPVAGTDLGALNLARRLADGEQIYVGVPIQHSRHYTA